MLSAIADVLLVPIVVGVAAGALAGSVGLGALAAVAALVAMYVWRNHIGPSRPPPELRPPRS